MMGAGIYAIVNTENGKVYIGATSRSVKERWVDHRSRLRRGVAGNPQLQRAWDQYGEDAFKVEVLEIVDDSERLAQREAYWLDFHRMRGAVYNLETLSCKPFLGRNHTDESRQKMCEAQANRSEETRRRMAEAKMGPANGMYGRKRSKETLDKVSKALLGHPVLEETRRKIGMANARLYPVFYNERTGEIIPAGHNLCALCRSRGLHDGAMWGVVHGKQSHHKGWVVAVEEQAVG